MNIKNLNLKLSTVHFGLDSEIISTSSNHNNIRLQSRVSQPHQLNGLLIRSYHTKYLSNLHTPLELNPLFITGFAYGPVSRSYTEFFFNKSINNLRGNRSYSTLSSKEDEGFYL